MVLAGAVVVVVVVVGVLSVGRLAFTAMMKFESDVSVASVAPPASRPTTFTRAWEVAVFGTVHEYVPSLAVPETMFVYVVPPFSEYESTMLLMDPVEDQVIFVVEPPLSVPPPFGAAMVTESATTVTVDAPLPPPDTPPLAVTRKPLAAEDIADSWPPVSAAVTL
jgi:hypothetical protein